MKQPEHLQEQDHFTDGAFSMMADARHFPLLLTRSRGKPSIEGFDWSIRWRNGWVAYAAQQGTKVYLIAEISEILTPNAAARKHMGETVANDLSMPGFLGTGSVVPSALLRGLMTALAWIAGPEKSGLGDNSSTLEEAINLAFKAYDRAGLKRPPIDPKTYQLLNFPG